MILDLTRLFVLLLGGTLLINATPDYWKLAIAAVLAVIMGILVKLALEWDRDRLTWKSAFTQTAFSTGIGYMTFFWLNGEGFMGMRQEVVLFIMSLVSAHIVSAINTVSKRRTHGIVEEIFLRIIAVKNKKQEEVEEEQCAEKGELPPTKSENNEN